MNKKLLILAPTFVALFLTSCGGGSAPSSTSATMETSKESSTSVVETSSEAVTSQSAIETSQATSEVQTSEQSSDISSAAESSSKKEESSSEVESSSKQEESSSIESSISITSYFTITFKDEDDNLLESKKWEEGSIPSYSYSKTDTKEWHYDVKGWSNELGGSVISLPKVSEDATYWAVVDKTKNQYTVTFDSTGGTTIDPVTVDYGTSIDAPSKPTKDGYSFSGWSYDNAGANKVCWPLEVTDDITLYGNWNETADIKGFLKTLISAKGLSPMDYIPEEMQPNYSANYVTESSVSYDFTHFNNISSIKYGGYGEQWKMVIDNIIESQRFYNVLTLSEAAINASVLLFNNYLDNNPSTTASHSLDETTYTASIDFHNDLLVYSLQLKTSFDLPLFGNVSPRIDMTYSLSSLERAVKIHLTDNIEMKYVVSSNLYAFGIEYGVEAGSRKAFFEVEKGDDSVSGHLYEYIQVKGKDLVSSAADFYINNTYTSVVGNKAGGMVGFKGYINELYKTNTGKLLGYEVRETLSLVTYNTLWFNLSDIAGLTNVKAIKNDNIDTGFLAKNSHDIYLNNSASIFTPAYNKKLGVKTSRKYDVEMRTQYFHNFVDGAVVEYVVEIPMMFIQAGNLETFASDMANESSISNASVKLSPTYLEKIQYDYAALIDIFISNKDNVTSDAISDFIG